MNHTKRYFSLVALGLSIFVTVLNTLPAAHAQKSKLPTCWKYLTAPGKAISQITTEDFNLFSDREKTLTAIALDYQRNHSSNSLAELIALGAPVDHVILMAREAVDGDLKVLEKDQNVRLLFHDRHKTKNPLQPSNDKTLAGFAEYYGLDVERQIFTKLQQRTNPTSSVKSADVLKAAMLTQDRELILRAFRQALHQGNYSELTALAADAKNNTALIQLARISIARYLFFDRNHNWLGDALRSIAEIEGGEREEMVQMLFDLHDLLRSPAILSNESQIRNYGNTGSIANYYEDAVRVLTATLPIARRFHGDSSASFKYEYAKTNDPRYVDRLTSLFNEAIDDVHGVGFLSPAIVQLSDTELLLHFARAAEAYSHSDFKALDERDQFLYPLMAMNIARDAYVTSGNLKEVQEFTKRAIDDPRFKRGHSPLGFAYGETALMAPGTVVGLYRSYLENPRQLSDTAERKDLSALEQWLNHYDHQVEANQTEIKPADKMFFAPSFWHEESSIQSFMDNGRDANPETLQEFKEAGNQKLATGAFWYAMGDFIAARDLDGLERTYNAMMTRGRPVDAKYAALAMEWIRTGQSPFSQSKLSGQSSSAGLLSKP